MQKNNRNNKARTSPRREGSAHAGHAARLQPGAKGRPEARTSANGRGGNANTAASKQSNRPQANQYTVQESMELLPFLLLRLNQGRNSVKSMLARGQISVNGRIVKEYNRQLAPGDQVLVSKEKIIEKLPFAGLTILHEDDDIIVILKDAGLLSIASSKEKDDELTAYRQLMAHVRLSDPKNRIFVVHRLDRDTSGVMMFAKNENAQQTLQNAWQDAVQERTYVALVEGTIKKPSGTIRSWLKESSTLKMYSSPYPNDGQLAITHYKTLQSNRQFSLLEVQLETGRKNQIRVHMEEIGHPIVGDKKYGSKSKIINRLGLHARLLAFVHPTTGEQLRFETPIPKSFLSPFKPAPTQ
ncbi:23S rRNA pseudouridine1911/1915/1917 synthase [Paenibacillus phyllosphaerae]|uniref:Pseudouridine synthase n=1 Tax=Paenibacillus phyllosphaerae TaxID=274593 RepID=A0A7W5FMK4_9BACL|nr:RluA family pseudouridine synthase [Paenibacillus phyllosphaerae]MBB3110218.1 23S rRNA pseudouridine1911/1915/1917 synthase [Paenibacillus phyllosphaerae]